jgi:GDP/UDP-N,N'-diacetylbacillosamine 2-epimerase (hydrolysing)
MRKVCVVTGTRAEFGAFYWLMKEIQNDPEMELMTLVTGMHLSPEFGLSWKTVEEAGFEIQQKIEMLLSSDTAVGITKSMGVALFGFAEAFDRLQPDLVVVLGDRYETFIAATAAMIAKIPLAHLHGGETTEGAFDEAMRHSITKMSHLHFTANEQYRKRVIQLGESPERVFNVGGLGIDNIKKLKLLGKDAFEEASGVKLNHKNLLITYHPTTLEKQTAGGQFQALLETLDALQDTTLIFTKPNSDTDGRIIIQMIDQYVADHPQKSIAFVSMGQLRFLSALQYVDAMAGNSSSGLAEAPSFKIGTINVGDRQKGRMKAESIIDCEPDETSIRQAFATLYSQPFQENLKTVKNPYGEGGAAVQIKKVLKHCSLDNILKKKFYDL